MKELIKFLEERGLKKQADSLRNGRTELDLWWCKIGDTDVLALAEAIADSPISGLVLGHNQMGNFGVIALANVITNNNFIAYLDLRDNQIGDDGVEVLAKAITHNSSITDLDILMNQIGNIGAIALAKVIKNNNFITYLDLSSNQIEDVGAIALAESIINNNSITYLDLRFNKISDAGAKAFSEALKYNTSLIMLDLEHNQISDNSILEIINEYIERNQIIANNKAEGLNAAGNDLFSQAKYSEAIEEYKSAIEITIEDKKRKLYEENKKNAEKKYKEQQTKLNQSIIVNKVEEHTKDEVIKKDLKNNDSDETAQLIKNLSTKASISDKQFDILVENKFVEQNIQLQDVALSQEVAENNNINNNDDRLVLTGLMSLENDQTPSAD
ncbi:hypothetical protein H6P87_00025 [Rickettsia tillamookensis]|uniref:Leucine Rich repeat family protein n=1 Tax=Rickettsia tillamookensis TaxID=2761623 RepID=A0A9E6MGP9_9RICK|nr:hypothetical protein [Rickettsia tillamookensis]QQV74491.1 hypothetical protein H6P87_00025 [Rickettsia tillamookensis]